MKNSLSNKRSLDIIEFISNLSLDKKAKGTLTAEKVNNLSIINEALTHSSSNSSVNYENLEFLGDAVLRLIASDFIKEKYPEMKVGERSELRSQLVSDQWLEQVGTKIHISKILIIGPKALGDTSARATIKAEATEALIGAIYECSKELKIIQKWLFPYWVETSIDVLNDPHRHNSKSALQEWSQSNGLELPTYKSKEMSKVHGDPKRFSCKVYIDQKIIGEGWGGSRKSAEKAAAVLALKNISQIDTI